MNVLLSLYRFIFCRPFFYRLNLHLYKLSLRGIGVLNSEGNQITGETWFMQWLTRHANIKTIVDVGANTGGYTGEILPYFPKAKIYACEPHPLTFQKLKNNIQSQNVKLLNIGLSNKSGKTQLWDFADKAPLKHTQPTSTLSSLHRDVIEQIYHQPAQGFTITLTTLDSLVQKQKIKKIDFLKIDTEGTELAVLEGAKKLLKHNRIGIVQFEFNEMNVFSRSFLKDFMELLPKHTFYRLMPHGFFPLHDYRPLTHEIFGFQNIVALPKNIRT